MIVRSDAASLASLRTYAEEAEALAHMAEAAGQWSEADWWMHEATVARDEHAILREWTV